MSISREPRGDACGGRAPRRSHAPGSSAGRVRGKVNLPRWSFSTGGEGLRRLGLAEPGETATLHQRSITAIQNPSEETTLPLSRQGGRAGGADGRGGVPALGDEVVGSPPPQAALDGVRGWAADVTRARRSWDGRGERCAVTPAWTLAGWGNQRGGIDLKRQTGTSDPMGWRKEAEAFSWAAWTRPARRASGPGGFKGASDASPNQLLRDVIALENRRPALFSRRLGVGVHRRPSPALKSLLSPPQDPAPIVLDALLRPAPIALLITRCLCPLLSPPCVSSPRPLLLLAARRA